MTAAEQVKANWDDFKESPVAGLVAIAGWIVCIVGLFW